MEDLMITLLTSLALASDPPVAAQMHERFAITLQIRERLVQGDLDGTRTLAQGLVDPPTEGLPAGWEEPTQALSTHAVALTKARDVGVAAGELSQMIGVCAGCHQSTEGGPGLEGMRGVPPQQWSEGDHMPLHLWAVDWLWLGMLAPSDEAWDRGAAELDSQPLARRFGDDEPTAKRLEGQVYALAKRAEALGADQRAEQVAVMGELLGTCATCHVLRDRAEAP
jgi:cytochrome c553